MDILSNHAFLFIVTIGIVLAFILIRMIVSKSHKTKRKNDLEEFSLFIAATAAPASALMFFKFHDIRDSQYDTATSIAKTKDSEMDQLKAIIKNTDAIIFQNGTNIFNTNISNSQEAQMQSLNLRVAAVQVGISNLQSLFISEPERAITLPLLKQQQEDIKMSVDSLQADVQVLRQQVSENATQSRWIIGTVALGLFGILLPHLRSFFDNKPKL
jgi:hypothetical protein